MKYKNMINAVSVIETSDEDFVSIRTFEDTPEGNKEAEAVFTACLKENDSSVTEDDIEDAIADGMYLFDGYELYLVHSYKE